jgi:diaminopimelate decarboxylase
MDIGLERVFPDTTQIDPSGHLLVGGCDAVELTERFGTPLYVFDEVTLRNRCRSFIEEFSNAYDKAEAVYASKAFINPAIARVVRDEGLGLDVVSGGEIAIAAAVEFPPEKVHFHGNNKTRQELEEALDWGIGRIVIDGFLELEMLDNLAGRRGQVQKVLLRLSPGIDPHTHSHTTTGVLDSKFGFPMETGQAAKAVRAALNAPNLDLVGFNCHLGSPIFELEPYQAAIQAVISFASEFPNEGLDLREFSPGGGFAIAYTRDDQPPGIAQYAEAIASTLEDACIASGLPRPTLIVEPGRSVAGPAGVALYQVGRIKEIPNVRTYAAVDGGMGDNIRPALYGSAYEAVVANRMDDPPESTVTIAGKYCESGDILVRDAMLPRLNVGDTIAIPATGAYSPSMASVYNLNPRPAIVMVRDGDARLIRRRESYQDLMHLDVL